MYVRGLGVYVKKKLFSNVKMLNIYYVCLLVIHIMPIIFQIHTQVASLTLFTCQGRKLKVENLTETEVIDILLLHEPHKVKGNLS